MSYTPPAGNAVDFSWVGQPAYTPPAGDAVNFSWADVAPDAIVVTGSGVIAVTGAGSVTHGQVINAAGAGAVSLSGAGVAAHGVALSGLGALSLTGAGSVVHPRYEVRGEVREGGVLVDRSVRVYDRLSGALIGEDDTAAGRFAIHTGFAEAEVYITPIDLSPAASDWLPPTANRVVAALAMDAA